MKNKNIIIIISIIIMALVLIILILKNNKIKINENEKYVASLHYSYSLGIDAGTEYTIKLYKNGENEYKYQIDSNNVTIDGVTEGKIIESGKINGKSDLKKLDDQYYKKKKNNMPFYSATYTYIEDNLSRNVNNIEELMDLLFN